MKKMMAFTVVMFAGMLPVGALHAQTAPQAMTIKGLGTVTLTPEGQAVVDEARAMATPAQQENFLLEKAKSFMTQNNVETAMGLAQYVIANINAKSLSAQKVLEDAMAMAQKKGQDQLNQFLQSSQQPAANAQAQGAQVQAQADQVNTDVNKTVSDVKNLFGSFGGGKK